MLTSISTVAAVIITPIAFTFWAKFLPNAGAMSEQIHVNPIEMVETIIKLIFIPLVLGMLINYKFEAIAAKVKRPIRLLSILIFFGFVIFAMIGNYQNIIDHVGKVF